ncbi:Trm112 family protein [Streptomyces fructofermentans]|uniref:Trm112 family protein n=1 Tax=Streptomyces fructofermentans TaxID=152141 RepID=UPI0033D56209
MNPDDPLLRILACPLDKGPLHLLAEEPGGGDALYNPRLRRRYPIVDGIPQLLPSSGEQVTEEEHEEFLSRLSADGDPGAPRRGPRTPGATGA